MPRVIIYDKRNFIFCEREMNGCLKEALLKFAVENIVVDGHPLFGISFPGLYIWETDKESNASTTDVSYNSPYLCRYCSLLWITQ